MVAPQIFVVAFNGSLVLPQAVLAFAFPQRGFGGGGGIAPLHGGCLREVVERAFRFAGTEVACSEGVEHLLLCVEHASGGIANAVDGCKRGLIVVVGDISVHHVVGHLRGVGGVGVALQELLEHGHRAAERHFATLHLGHGKIVERSFLNGLVGVHAHGLVESQCGGVIVSEFKVGLSDVEERALAHGRIVGGDRRERADGFFILAILEFGHTEDVACRWERIGG